MNRTYFQYLWTIMCWGPLIVLIIIQERNKRREKDDE